MQLDHSKSTHFFIDIKFGCQVLEGGDENVKPCATAPDKNYALRPLRQSDKLRKQDS